MNNPLAVYLHDHLAGASFASELLEKLATAFPDTPTGDLARDLFEEVQSDKRVLEQLIGQVGETNRNLHDALGWMAERLSRVKLAHDEPSGIGAFEALETISLWIVGKRGLWEVLRNVQNFNSRLKGFNYDALIKRADQQFQSINQYRLELAGTAFHELQGHS